jgi:hypothetical protein
MKRLACIGLLAAILPLAGCDLLGIESAEAVAARREADSKAVGAACRHAARALEDCYTLNRKADKAAVYAGWLEMNDYMREHKIEAVAPQHGAAAVSAAAVSADPAAPPGAPASAGPPGGAPAPPAEAPARPHES